MLHCQSNPGQDSVTTPTRGEWGGASRQWWEVRLWHQLVWGQCQWRLESDINSSETPVCDSPLNPDLHPSYNILHYIICSGHLIQAPTAGTLNPCVSVATTRRQHLTIRAWDRVPSLVTPSALSKMILQSLLSTSCACCSLKATLALHALHSKMLTPSYQMNGDGTGRVVLVWQGVTPVACMWLWLIHFEEGVICDPSAKISSAGTCIILI